VKHKCPTDISPIPEDHAWVVAGCGDSEAGCRTGELNKLHMDLAAHLLLPGGKRSDPGMLHSTKNCCPFVIRLFNTGTSKFLELYLQAFLPTG
jgi:hypothetical protein